MKRIAPICLLLALSPNALAQNFKGREESFKNWSDGPLTEADFVERHVSGPAQGTTVGELDWLISFDPVTDRIGNLRFRHVQSSTRMDRLSSWRDPSVDKPWSLDYFQTEFNMVEIYRRKVQDELNTNPLDYQDIKDYYMRLLSSASDTYHMETDHGNDAAAVARYSVQYREELDRWEPKPLTEPQFTRRALGYGIFAGYMGECYGAPVSTAIGPLFHGFSFGFDFPVHRVYLGFEGTLGAGSALKQDNFYYDPYDDYYWVKGKKCTNGEMSALLGYTFLDTPRIALCPVAGVGVSFLDQKTGTQNSGGSDSSEIHGLRLQAGMNVSVKLKRTLDVGNYYGGGSYDETNLVFKVYGAHSQFTGLGEVWSVQFGVALDFVGWILKNNRNVETR